MLHRIRWHSQCTALRAALTAAQAAKVPPARGGAEEVVAKEVAATLAATLADRARRAGEAAKGVDAGAQEVAAGSAAAAAGLEAWAAIQEGGVACSMEGADSVAEPGAPTVGMWLSSCRCDSRPASTPATRHRRTGRNRGGPLPRVA